MHKLIALYHPPADTAAFTKHLKGTHLPLVAAFPGLQALRYGLDLNAGENPSPYFAFVECEFADQAALQAALESEQGAAAVADVPNYASAGVEIEILTFSSEAVAL